MRTLTPRRRVTISALVLLLIGAMALSFSLTSIGTKQASAASYRAHAINVNPEIVGNAGVPNASGLFPCQVATTPYRCYGPAQIQNAYAISPLYASGITGVGKKIVIVDAFQSPTLHQDFGIFNKTFGLKSSPLATYAPDGLTPWNANDPNQVGWAEEISLDVQWSHAIAPDAQINLVLAKTNNDTDILSATKYAVDHNLGDVISQSFGEGESCVDPKLLVAEHALFTQATAKGITLLASSADDGSAEPACDGSANYFKSVSSPASDPLVTGVGGTQLHANLLTGLYHDEVAWNEPYLPAASGGGFSKLYAKPAFQNKLTLPGRGVPDIAYNASVDYGVLTSLSFVPAGHQGGTFHIFGGTSAGSPQWAGLVALANQIGGHRLGTINPALYSLAQGADYKLLFHDVTSGTNMFKYTNPSGNLVTIPGYDAGKGWDAVTGWGSPVAATLLPVLAQATA